jgi:acyl-coenzyme A thioesterase PaaI-like protein
LGRGNITKERQQPITNPIKEYPDCFGCGQDNPIGLRLNLRLEGDRLKSSFVPKKAHEGWPGTVLGGIITALLYEIMENLMYRQGAITMMRGMEARLRSPASVGKKLLIESWMEQRSGREISVHSELKDEDGKLIAQGKASLVELNQDQIERLGIT